MPRGHEDISSILLFARRAYPSIGGVERYIHELGTALTEGGRRVVIVAGDDTGQLPPCEQLGPLEVHRVPTGRSPLRAWSRMVRLASLFRSVDVVNISDVGMLEYYHRMIGRRVGPRSITLTRHGISARDPVPDSERLRSRRARAWVDAMFDDGFFIEKRLGTQPDFVPDQGLSPRAGEIEQRAEPAKPSAIFFGRLDSDTGIEIYLDALAALRARHGIELPLAVYAAGPLEGEARARAERDRLAVTWHAPRPDARELVFGHTFAFVSGRMAIQEAMARRRAVVAAYVDPIKRDYVCAEPFSAHVVAASRGEELADLVAALVRRPEERAGIVERAFDHASRLSWRATADVYLSTWRNLACASGRRSELITPGALRAFALQLRREVRGELPRMIVPESRPRGGVLVRGGADSGMCMR